MMLKLFTALLLAVVASIIPIVTASAIPPDNLPQPFNKRPNKSNRYFKTDTAMWSNYIHYEGADDFCKTYRDAADSTIKASGITFKEVGCKIVDRKYNVAVVYATVAHHHAHRFSYTGPVGNSIHGTTWVYPKHDAYDFQGGGCHKVVHAWCFDDGVRPGPVDLDPTPL